MAGYWGGKKVCRVEVGAKTKTSPPRQTKGNFFHISRRNPKSLLNAKESIQCKLLWANIPLWSDLRYSKIFQQWKSGPEIYVRRLLKKFYGSRSLIVSSERQIGETFIHCHCTFPLNFWWNLTIREKKGFEKEEIRNEEKNWERWERNLIGAKRCGIDLRPRPNKQIIRGRNITSIPKLQNSSQFRKYMEEAL